MEEKGSLFTTEDVAVIFGNLREIHTFQEQFLEQLEIAFRHGKKYVYFIGPLPVDFRPQNQGTINVFKVTKFAKLLRPFKRMQSNSKSILTIAIIIQMQLID